jgi:hypothetical protein
MGNFVKGPKHVLINELTADSFGVYTRSSDDAKVLQFRGENGAPVDFVAGEIKSRMFGLHTDGVKGSWLLELIAPAPADNGMHYTTGVDVAINKHWNGKIFNPWTERKYYSGTLKSLQSTVDGEIADGDKLALLKQIVEMINEDRNAIVKASIAYVLTNNDDTGDQDVVVDGTTVTVTAGDAIADEINTAVDTVRAYKNVDDNSCIVMPIDNKGYFLVSEVSGDDVEITNFYLKLDQLYVEVVPDITFETNLSDWDAISKVFQYEITYAGASADDLNLSYSVNEAAYTDVDTAWDTSTNVTAGDAVDALIAETSKIVAIHNDTDKIIYLTVIGANEFDIIAATDNDFTLSFNKMYNTPRFPILTGKQVFEDMFGLNQGHVVNFYHETAQLNKNYCVLSITKEAYGHDNVVPNSDNTRYQEFQFIIEESQLEKDVWEAPFATNGMNHEDETGTADRNLFGLLHYWIGERPDGGAEVDDVDLDTLELDSSTDWIHV